MVTWRDWEIIKIGEKGLKVQTGYKINDMRMCLSIRDIVNNVAITLYGDSITSLIVSFLNWYNVKSQHTTSETIIPQLYVNKSELNKWETLLSSRIPSFVDLKHTFIHILYTYNIIFMWYYVTYLCINKIVFLLFYCRLRFWDFALVI